MEITERGRARRGQGAAGWRRRRATPLGGEGDFQRAAGRVQTTNVAHEDARLELRATLGDLNQLSAAATATMSLLYASAPAASPTQESVAS